MVLEQAERPQATSSATSPLPDDNGTRPFIAIAVLVCGVIGGLIMVISFIFFCKYCFKKKQPLDSIASPTTKRAHDDDVLVPGGAKSTKGRGSVASMMAQASGRRGYEVLSGANAVVHPVPVDLEAYLQQPVSVDNNNAATPPDLAVSSTALVGGAASKKAELLQKKLTKLAEEQLLIAQNELEGGGEDEYDEDPTLAQVSDSNLVQSSGGNHDDEEYEDLFIRVGPRRSEKSDPRSLPPSKKPSSASQGYPQQQQPSSSNGVSDVGGGGHGRQRSASNVAPRQHHRQQQQQQQQVGRRVVDSLAVSSAATEEVRRRSFDDRLSTSEQAAQRRRSPAASSAVVGADYYASEYDRKHSVGHTISPSAAAVDFQHRPSPTDHSRRHTTKGAISVPSPSEYQQQSAQQQHRPQRSPIAHLPRSHQMIVDKTSPPPSVVQQQTSISTTTSSTNGVLVTETPSSKMYTRDHRNAVSYGAAEQDFSVSEKNMYARGHRLAFSFTDTGAERAFAPPPHTAAPHRDGSAAAAAAASMSPDRRSTDECASFSSAFEYESLEKFCRECRAVFQAAAAASAAAGTTTTSSSSSGPHHHYPHQHNKRNGGPVIHLPRQRQVKSLDMVDPNRRAAVQHQRQVHSLDASCVACMNDALHRMALLAGGDNNANAKLKSYAAAIGTLAGQQATSTSVAPGTAPPSGPSGAVLKRQLTLIESAASCDDEAESELMHLDDAQSEQVKQECKQLWNLRSVFEDDPPEPTAAGGMIPMMGPARMIIIDDQFDDTTAQQSLDAEELETGATTSYTTSFESNTEPLTVEDYLRSRPSGPYLEPPRLTVEAKRQKLRSLYARRQMQLQQQGASIESYESVETVDSSSSGKPELILTSTESNQEHINAMAARANGTDQQQTSLSFDSSVGGDAEGQAIGQQAIRPAIVRGNDYLTPSVSAAHRHHTPSRERRAVEAFFDVVSASGNGAEANGTETDRSDVLSGESFDDSGAMMAAASAMAASASGSGAAHHQAMPAPPPPPYPNIHLFRMRRQYEGGSSNGGGAHRFAPPAPPPPQLRDYCVDARTEAIFREFVRYDPRLETLSVRGHPRRHHPRRFHYHANGGGASYENDSAASSGGRGKLTQENSIDEDPHFGTTSAVTSGPGRYDIPVIRLPEDDLVAPSTAQQQQQHRPPSGHPLVTAMVAKG